jgi:DNA polymerase III epsilon subunit-like protein
MEVFVAKPLEVASSFMAIFLDLETTGLNVTCDRIVEIGAVELSTGAAFSSIVNPGSAYLGRSEAVHGIGDDELEAGPVFPEAFGRFSVFADFLADMALSELSDSSSEEEEESHLRSERPTIILAAHNGVKFDFPMLMSECSRHRIYFGDGIGFVDTLAVIRALDSELYGACLKLQCLTHRFASASGLRAHRALDDCFMTRDVIVRLSQSLDTSPLELMRRFATHVDVDATLINLSCLASST